ncbi:flavodoxin [Lacticaseibacillus brantae]|uniref:Twin-arginine translocation pathway signal n=1 Tax=Lacticaseibacillus brantae DSM 23927 TaxID=1423727 RepID=A0A0R2AYH2_9LACO|nr:flavodoxin [Lacticaseibacillus brantae]KRM72048.1 twin-arginine translocation pathway signal [Lacticaseibacillus brantae DSM 23927]
MMMATNLVVYFSVSGTTKHAAETIAKLTGADIAELTPVEPYSREYDEVVARGQQEKDSKARPAVEPLSVNPNAYQTIYVGFPTWWGQPPMVIQTFFETSALKGKRIIPFTTSVTSTIADSWPMLQQLSQSAQATLEPGLTANSTTTIRQFIQ